MRRPRPASDLDDLSAPLRADVRRLGTVLGEVIAEAGGAGLLADVERVRKAAIALRAARGAAADRRLAAIVRTVDGFPLEQAEAVARAFTVYFQLANLAEERHRVRILRERSRSPEPVRESIAATVAELRQELGESELVELVGRLDLRPVLTAHPTEARRRAVVDGLRRVAQAMDGLDDPRASAADLAEAERRLREQVAILWRTSQLRARPPAPQDEVRSLMAVFDETLFTLAPVVYRELQRALPGARVPAFLHLGSWIGGDRDGNPNVTHSVTEAAIAIQSRHALLGLEAAARRIGRSLTLAESVTPPSAELSRRLAAATALEPGVAREVRANSPGEPHREFLLLVAERLAATRQGGRARYATAAELVDDLSALRDSLTAGGAARVADGELLHLLWQAQTYGFHLASLEVRQHSDLLGAAIGELAPGAGGDAAALDRLEPPDAGEARSEATREVLATLRSMAAIQARFGPDACRRFIISFSHRAADIVAVAALARLAVPEGGLELEVVPLFESRADLEAAPGVLDELLALPRWRADLERRGRRLEVMLGYSDAAKDAGYLSANLSLYRAQSELVAWARRNRVELTLFHGRGGALGRGGGPAGRAIRSQAPGSVGGRFKITEQGEVIFARYGNRAIALRHLEQVTSSVLVASTPAHERRLAAADRFREAAEAMAAVSEAAYRELVEASGFAEFTAAVTPLEHIAQLGLGSRPASRRAAGRVPELSQLRAIPWVFAWTQNRCNLPGWYGLGSGFQSYVEREGLEALKRMVAEWPFLASVVDNAEMSLAKADPVIAGRYLERGGRPDLVDRIREEYRLTRRLVLEVTGSRRLLDRHPILRLAVDLRNPYVDALSLLQLRFLRELDSAGPAESARLGPLVRLTIGGIAAALQNTG